MRSESRKREAYLGDVLGEYRQTPHKVEPLSELPLPMKPVIIVAGLVGWIGTVVGLVVLALTSQP